MKKLIALLIVFALVTSCSSSVFAEEEFQLRNGIQFGDTFEIVNEKETLTREGDLNPKNNMIWYNGTIAGMDGAVRYEFSKETGGLIEMLYKFYTTDDRDSRDIDYNKLKDSLIRKYGEPLGNTGGSVNLITGSAFSNSAMLIASSVFGNGNGDYRDYDEWVVYSNGFNVKIDLVYYYYKDVFTKSYEYGIEVSYLYFTNEDFQGAVQEVLDEQALIDNDM